jgi:hypothetical protein
MIGLSHHPIPGIGGVRKMIAMGFVLALVGNAAEQAKVVVVVNLQEKDFVSMTGIRMRRRMIPLVDFDFKAAFTQELMDRLAADKRMQYRLAKPEDNIPPLPPSRDHYALPAKVYKSTIPANLDANLVLQVQIDAVGATTALGLTNYLIEGTMVMLNRQGKALWFQTNYVGDSSTFPDWQIGVEGSVDDHQSDNQKLMKENINKIIEKYCASKTKKILNKEFQDKDIF